MSMERTWKVSVGEVQLGDMPQNTLRFALILRASLFHITDDFTIMTLLKFLHTPLNGVPQKCFQSAPALAKGGPAHEPQKSKLKWAIVPKVLLLQFYLYKLVEINWLKLLFKSIYNVSPFLLVCVGNISFAAVSLLTKCTKHCMACRNSQKYVSSCHIEH